MYTNLYRKGVWDNSAPQAKTAKKATKKEKRIVASKTKRYGCKVKEPRVEREKKEQPEKVKEKIKEKEEKTKLGLETTANVLSAMLDLLEDATEEEIKGDLHVESIDFQIPTNTKKHFTDRYKSTQRVENTDLVLRRGYTFQLCIALDREYCKADHDINFIFSTGAYITEDTWMKVPMEEDVQDEDSKIRKSWHAQLVSMDKKTIVVEITIAPNSIIGEWFMSIESFTKHKGEDIVSLTYSSDQSIIILLNPWCPADTCYYPTTKELDEYVLNPKGAVYQGNYKQIHPKPWRFGQFDDGILDICLMILDKAFEWHIGPHMADPVIISRAISGIINNCDNYGVLHGRWDGEYADGKSPTSWQGSVKILRQFARDQVPVMYGQCWVFSGLVVTVCRALGLPCKSVTNFASAHDTDNSLTIDNVYVQDPDKPKGYLKPSPEHSSDSCWNFHVWNEVWMARYDLPPGNDGWQVIDATPQETSEGRFTCGPASLAAIKNGDCMLKYDTRFVFAEVNADFINWQIEDGIWKKMFTSKRKVGKKISTKNPENTESLERLDVTCCYKFPEASKQERESVARAATSSLVDRDEEVVPQDIDIDIKDIDDVIIGSNVEIRVKVKNVAESKETRTVKEMHADVYTMKYNGRCDQVNGLIRREDFPHFSLKAGEEKVFKMVITKEEYERKIICLEQAGMEVKAYAMVEETNRAIVEKEDFRVRRPDVDVKMSPLEAGLNGNVDIKMSLKNPLSVPLTHCSFSICSEAMQLNDEEEVKVDDVPPYGEWNTTLTQKVWECPLFGVECISVAFDCKEIPNISGVSNSIRIL